MHQSDWRDTFNRIAYWQQSGPAGTRFPGTARTQAPRYLTCEIDSGGFNNIRQAFEFAVIVAAISGRVLVLPPPCRWYLINYGPLTREGEPDGVSSIEDFFDIAALSRYVPVITAFEMAALERTRLGIPAEYFDHGLNSSAIGHQVEVSGRWNHWLRENAQPLLWNPLNNVIFHPDIQSVLDAPCAPAARFMDKRVAVEMDDMLMRAPILHLPCDNDRGLRQLGQVSTMVAFNNTEEPDLVRQLLRNGVHYVPRIFEIAARLVSQLGLFQYTAIHLRRNDFQYKEVKVASSEIAVNIAPVLRSGEPLYVATDETDSEFLAALRHDGRILTWADLLAITPGLDVPPWLVACIEQVVCAGARVFVGTRYSTMSSYIVRLRGYIGAPETATYYHTESLQDSILADHTIRPVSGQEYMREDETLWRDHRNGYGPRYSVICTDTHPSVQWQCELLEHTWRAVRQPGELVRLVATDSSHALPEHQWARVVQTRYSNIHPDTGDDYPPYNRLYSFQQWITEHNPEGNILILDPDYVFRAPVTESVGVGTPLAQVWVDCGAWGEDSRFVKIMPGFSSARREDLQRVTWPALIHSEDFKRLVPRWIELTAHYREQTGAWESDMVAFVVASAELGLRYKLSNMAAWMNWPEELVKGAPIVHYCQVVEDSAGERLWWKRDYRPWQRLNVAPQQARLDYCRDLLAIIKKYAAWRRSGETERRKEPDMLDVRVHLRGRQPVQLYCEANSPALADLFEMMEADADSNQKLYIEIDAEQRIEFSRSDLIAIETGFVETINSTGDPDDDLVRVTVKVSGMPEFALLSEPDSPAVQALRSALAANMAGAADEMMYLQTEQTQRVYFLRSCLQAVNIGPEMDS